MMSTLHDAIEERYVVTLDIPGAFLQTDQPGDDEVIIRSTGTMVEWLAKIDSKIYRGKITIKKTGRESCMRRLKRQSMAA